MAPPKFLLKVKQDFTFPSHLFRPPLGNVKTWTLGSLPRSLSSHGTLSSASVKRVSKWFRIKETKCTASFRDGVLLKIVSGLGDLGFWREVSICFNSDQEYVS